MTNFLNGKTLIWILLIPTSTMTHTIHGET